MTTTTKPVAAKAADLTAKGYNPPRPRRNPGAKTEPTLRDIDMLPQAMQQLAEQLDTMPSEELRKTAGNLRIKWEAMTKPAIIEAILAVEEDAMRAARARQQKEQDPGPKEKPLPADPDVTDGVALFSPLDMALIFAALLPADALVNVQAHTAQTFNRNAQRIGQEDAVMFSRFDSSGVERRYRIEVGARTGLKVIALP